MKKKVFSLKKPEAENLRIAQSKQTRQRLLDASLELFVYKGYGSTTIRDITSKAKVSPGLLFHYFDSKEAMLSEHIAFMNQGIDSIAQLLSDSTKPPLAVFEQVAAIILESFQEEKGRQLFLLSNQIGTSVYIPAAIRNSLKNTSSIEHSLAVIERGQSLGVIKPGDPQVLALTFWGALHGVVELLVWQPKASLPEADHIIAILKV